MHDDFVIVHRTHDSIQADMLGEILRDGGIAARVIGTRSAAAIGVGQNIVQVYIEVPQAQAGQATDFLEAFFSGDAMDGLAEALGFAPDEDEDDGGARVGGGAREPGDGEGQDHGGRDGDDPVRERELRPLLAAGSAFLTFGAGHLYARRPLTAAALAAGQLVAMVLLFGGRSWNDWTVGVTLLGGLLACDLVGAPLAVRTYRRGFRRRAAWQAAVGATYVAATVGLALVVGPRLARPDAHAGHLHQDGFQPAQPGRLEQSFQHTPSFPPLTSQHPANPFAHQ